MRHCIAWAALAFTTPAFSQNVDPVRMDYQAITKMDVPVIEGDITDHPYRVVGQIKTNVRKATIFSHASSDDKMKRELWERAKKMGADAVVNAKLGDEHISAMSWGASTARGTAIKFVESNGAAN
jgi:uncharacterized protein YbjQ (UPF0145 family)